MAYYSMYWQNSIFQAQTTRLNTKPMTDFSNKILVLTSCKGSITAKKIAREVVAQELASKVRVVSGVNTFFRWVGKVDQNEEHLLLMKSSLENFQALEKSIKRLYPHELIEITAVPVYSTSTFSDPD